VQYVDLLKSYAASTNEENLKQDIEKFEDHFQKELKEINDSDLEKELEIFHSLLHRK
jgi:hypothetical protein